MRFLPLAVAILAALLFALVLLQPKAPAVGTVGQAVAPVTLPALGGGEGPLFGGKVTVVNVFASWCVPCAAEMGRLATLAGAGVDIVGVAYKDKPETLQDFLKKYGNPYSRVLLDSEGRAALALAITGVPETFVIDGGGKVVWHFPAALEDDHLTQIEKAAGR